MAVRVTPCKIVAAIRETIEEWLVEILLRDGAVSLARSTLVCQEKILRHGIRLVPGPGLVFTRSPIRPLLDGLGWQMRQGGVGSLLENRKRLRIADVLVRINQPANQLVVAVSREPVLFVELSGDDLCVEPVQAQDFLSRGLRSGNRVIPCQRRYPLTTSR